MLTEKTITVYICKCNKCGHQWEAKRQKPLRCAKCKTPYWDREKTK